MARFLILLVRRYQRFLSPPKVGAYCIYMPMYSQYIIGALRKYGTLKDTRLACKRVLGCHPLVEGGYDPVPQRLEGIRIE